MNNMKRNHNLKPSNHQKYLWQFQPLKKITAIALILFFTISIPQSELLAQTNTETGTTIGKTLPDIALQNPEGETLKLSDLRGSIVLVDFWASWCRPCRRENPVVREAYSRFAQKKFDGASGFKIFSVSLDNNKSAWTEAISADSLYWSWHVSDLQGWRSTTARQMGVRSIPANFLIDQDGVILATNLRGLQLEQFLEKIVLH